MPKLLQRLKWVVQGSPANPAAGEVATWFSNDTVPRLKTRNSSGVERYLPYEFYYNVRDYGATGNGTTDDAASIQAALDLASSTNPGSTMFIPPGTYKINSELEIKGAVKILCAPGAVIKRGSSGMQYMIKNFNASYAPTLYAGRGNIHIEGGTWDADGATITAACTVIVIAHADRVSIQDATIQNVPDWHAIEVNSSKRVRIDNCNFEGFNFVSAGRHISEAIQIDLAISSGALPGIGAGAIDNTPCDDVIVRGCTASGLGSLGSYGTLVGTHSAVTGFRQTNIQVIGNKGFDLMHYGVTAYNWQNAVIANNIFEDCNGGVEIQIPTGVSGDIERFTLNGNQFIGMGVQNGAPAVLTNVNLSIKNGTGVVRHVVATGNIVKNFANPGSAFRFQDTSDVVCSNNSVRNGTHATLSVGFTSNNSAFGVYSGNKIDSVTDVGFRIANISTECSITGNVINTNSYGIGLESARCVISGNVFRIATAASAAIWIHAAGEDAQIVGNFIRMSAASPTEPGIEITAAMDIMIQGNTIKGWGATEGATGPIFRFGTLDPAMATTQVTTANVNSYE